MTNWYNIAIYILLFHKKYKNSNDNPKSNDIMLYMRIYATKILWEEI